MAWPMLMNLCERVDGCILLASADGRDLAEGSHGGSFQRLHPDHQAPPLRRQIQTRRTQRRIPRGTGPEGVA